MYTRIRTLAAAVAVIAAAATAASAAVTPSAGYIYTTELLSNLTQGCVAAGPGGTFVGIGPSFTANAEAIVLAKESGELHLVALGFNSISDCAYDRATDTLYVTDNANNADLGITTSFGNTGAQTGDTVYAVPSASSATGRNATDLELLPADSVPFAANVTLDGAGTLLVANPVGAGAGEVLKIAIAGPTSTSFASSLELVGGIAVNPANGNVFIAQNLGLPDFKNEILEYTGLGAAVPPVPFTGPSFAFGSVDLTFNSDGKLLASGNFLADVVSFDPTTAASTPFVSGLTFATGTTVDPFTHRVEILSSQFNGGPEDRSLHRFTPIDRLAAGGGSSKSDCVHEFYGIELVDKTATCVDGAPCDADGKENGSCLFAVGFCFDVADPALSECAADTVTDVTITAKPASAAVTNAAGRISDALPIGGTTCVFSDGIAVPVQIVASGKKAGKAQVKVASKTSDGRKDTDVAKLVCQPAP